MFQRVSETRAQWGSMLALVLLIGLMTLMPTRVTAEELPSVVATVQGQPIAVEDLTNALRGATASGNPALPDLTREAR
jgi:hypothetical protein